ncbi:dirigent protein 17-like [Rutidosis leptorrhynchoides]|uniref:dirigent protein 17-like n=1 Tax=Rutidosis leptorrhynchoides TaxID=125765 RepID=UPI003A98FFE6
MEKETTLKEGSSDSLTPGIYEIPGEPALVINGVPPVCTNDNVNPLAFEVESEVDSKITESLGDWLEGREVQKLFEDNKLYNGKVKNFDQETGWYRVVYEDGDFEDLEWHELEPVLLPIDVAIPLKTLASKVIKKKQKLDKKSGKSATKP